MKQRNNNKKESNILQVYADSDSYSIRSIYRKPSISKLISEDEIIGEMCAVKGWGYKIIGYNPFHYSAGYFFTVPINGINYTAFTYHTSSSRFIFFVDAVPWDVFKKTAKLSTYVNILRQYSNIQELNNKYAELKQVHYNDRHKDGRPKRVHFIDSDIPKQETLELDYVVALYNEINKGLQNIEFYKFEKNMEAIRETNKMPPSNIKTIKNITEFTEVLNNWKEAELEAEKCSIEAEHEKERLEWSLYMDAIL